MTTEINNSTDEVYQLKISLQGIKPMIWRRVLVSSGSSIADLHYTIQIAMEWDDVHLHQFHIRNENFGIHRSGGIHFSHDPKQVLLSSFAFEVSETFTYEYDFGDDWLHNIRIEKILKCNPKKTYPICTAGKYATPPEDCGGIYSYMEMRDDLKCKALGIKIDIGRDYLDEDDEYDDEYEYLDAEGNLFDPDVFNIDRINGRLRQYASGDREWLFATTIILG
jgi:hypothetical protein